MGEIKKLNKETVSWALLDNFDLPEKVIEHIVDVIWKSDELLEAHQNYVAARQVAEAGEDGKG